MSRLARGLVHLGEVLLAAGAIELYPSVTGGTGRRGADDSSAGGTPSTRSRANLMTVHLTSTVRIGEDRAAHRRRQLRPGVGVPESARERCVAAPGRARREPAGHDHGASPPATSRSSSAS